MSAFLHSNAHIDVLIRAGLRKKEHWDSPLQWVKPGTNPTDWASLTPETATDVGRMLVAENVRNLQYLYEDRLGPDEVAPPPYVYVHRGVGTAIVVETYEPVAVLKAAASYAYQCCDYDGWENSEAKAFIEQLRLHLIRQLPGYDEADTWSIG